MHDQFLCNNSFRQLGSFDKALGQGIWKRTCIQPSEPLCKSVLYSIFPGEKGGGSAGWSNLCLGF